MTGLTHNYLRVMQTARLRQLWEEIERREWEEDRLMVFKRTLAANRCSAAADRAQAQCAPQVLVYLGRSSRRKSQAARAVSATASAHSPSRLSQPGAAPSSITLSSASML